MVGRRNVSCALALLTTAALAGCSRPARAPRMEVHDLMSQTVAHSAGLEESFTVGDVTGGSETNPLWTPQVGNDAFRAALERSLQANRMLAAMPDSARYVVFARLLEVERPVVGLAMRVAPRIAYRVVERGVPGEVFREEITTSYVAQFEESPLGAERLRLANEGAIRESIREFLNRFRDVWLARLGPPSNPPPAAEAEAQPS